MATKEEANAASSRMQPRRTFAPSKRQPRSRLKPKPDRKPNLQCQSTRSSSSTRKSSKDSEVDETDELRQRRLPLYLNLYNSILGGIGLVSALCFGVITIVQADTANKEARIANKIAGRSLLLSMVQTCVQIMDVSNSTMCVLVEGFVKEAFWPKNEEPDASWNPDVGLSWYLPGALQSVRCGWAVNSTNNGDWKSEIKKVVVLVEENRSFDTFAGGLDYAYRIDPYLWAPISPDNERWPTFEESHGNFGLPHGYFDSAFVGNLGWQVQNRIYPLINLLLLLWFLVSGLVLKLRGEGDFATLIMRRKSFGRLDTWIVVECCVMKVYYIYWLDLMIGFMLQEV